MISKMIKFNFLIFHSNYEKFLTDIQEIGTVHIKPQNLEANNTGLPVLLSDYSRIEATLKELSGRLAGEVETGGNLNWEEVVDKVDRTNLKLIETKKRIAENRASIKKFEAWGNYSENKIKRLKQFGVNARFFKIKKDKFNPDWLNIYPAQIINKAGKDIFILSFSPDFNFSEHAEEVQLPETDSSASKNELAQNEKFLNELENDLDELARSAIPVLKQIQQKLHTSIEFKKVLNNHTLAFGKGKIKALEGWIPEAEANQLIEYLEKEKIVYQKQIPANDKEIPIQLRNNWFVKLFEPIGKMYSLPKYNEVDLTIYFAPFFLIFFGFCLGDAGYGILILLGASVYKLRAQKKLKPYLTLAQFFGGATLVMGMLFGTFFGIELSKIAQLSGIKELFLDSSKIFYLSLIIGAVQIVFGMAIKVANKVRQFGWIHALGTIGWILVLLTTAAFAVISPELTESNPALTIVRKGIYIVSVILILFFTNPEGKIHMRFASGLWDIYSMVSGIFGDLLSYIRLFALGLSSSILGLVVNQMAVAFSEVSYIGPLLFIIIILLGHTLNILISSLGSFVHPMRLTLVEFYKNAGFTGGGTAYNPFSKYRITN